MIPYEMRGRDFDERRAIRAAEGRSPDAEGVAVLVQALFAVVLAAMLLAIVVTS